ncbi:hypothetical protein BC374_20315 [Ensifer sp. LC13]|nr:hypothetical protein BBX50_23450 [Ensifer sp. LC11]OCP09094.1 hypothetical protein BC374_20315 [Ensifer sp. LC13]OCP09877.1 hypothetical protein BC362_09090 [Ensifer sp. LC14]OCP31592.1 hypothetical protein BC364_23300 [Ensifer sp. LC499]
MRCAFAGEVLVDGVDVVKMGQPELREFRRHQTARARSHHHVQPRKPLAIESNDPRLNAALIIMEQHTENTISIAELAASVGLSRRQLERLFMDKAKMSPALVYRKFRLERAKHLLTQTDASLIEIALEVGFESAGHFSRIFAKAYGQSPSRLRAQQSM